MATGGMGKVTEYEYFFCLSELFRFYEKKCQELRGEGRDILIKLQYGSILNREL